MQATLRRLLDSVVDDAGMVSPSSLDGLAALERHRLAKRSSHAWLVGRLVCEAHRLHELAPLAGEETFKLCIVGRGSRNKDEWDEARSRDAEDLNAFLKSSGERVSIETYEVRVPDVDDLNGYLYDLRGFEDTDRIVELPVRADMFESLALIAEREEFVVKIPAGGEHPPTVEMLAHLLHDCVALDQPIKLSGDVHHALARNGHAGSGFVNLLMAVALGVSEELTRREIEGILAESNAQAFHFDSESAAWRGFSASRLDIDVARELLTAFTCASTEESVSSLRALGWWATDQ